MSKSEKPKMDSNQYLDNEKIMEKVNSVFEDHWKSIGQLATGVAHEINNPLGFLENNIYVLQMYVSKLTKTLEFYKDIVDEIGTEDKYKEKIDEFEKSLQVNKASINLVEVFRQSQEGVDRIKGIIESLKSFSKMNTICKPTVYSLNDGIANTLIISKSDYRYHCDIITDYGDLGELYCEGGKINQVILNIIINASQSIKEKLTSQGNTGKGLIQIKTYEDNEYQIARIEDSGVGIEDSSLSKIFNPFFTTKTPDQGTGLGLSVSYDILKKQGGTMWATRTVGKGAIFYFKLPKKSVFQQ